MNSITRLQPELECVDRLPIHSTDGRVQARSARGGSGMSGAEGPRGHRVSGQGPQKRANRRVSQRRRCGCDSEPEGRGRSFRHRRTNAKPATAAACGVPATAATGLCRLVLLLSLMRLREVVAGVAGWAGLLSFRVLATSGEPPPPRDGTRTVQRNTSGAAHASKPNVVPLVRTVARR
jgi:hypothetical protein